MQRTSVNFVETNKTTRVPHLLVLFLFFVAALTVDYFHTNGFEGDPDHAGRSAARRDITSGRLVIRVYGLRRYGHAEFDRILKESYGIETDVVAGCVVTESLCQTADAYDDIMIREIERRFGKGFLKRVWSSMDKDRP